MKVLVSAEIYTCIYTQHKQKFPFDWNTCTADRKNCTVYTINAHKSHGCDGPFILFTVLETTAQYWLSDDGLTYIWEILFFSMWSQEEFCPRYLYTNILSTASIKHVEHISYMVSLHMEVKVKKGGWQLWVTSCINECSARTKSNSHQPNIQVWD